MHAGAFNWTYTLGTGLMDPWAIGATALIPEAGIAPAQLPLLLKRFDATIFAAAPGVYRQMLKMPVPALPRLRHGLSAGEKMPETDPRRLGGGDRHPVYEALGMSEVSTYVSACPARPAPPGTAGFPQPGRRVAVLGR
jgi:acyl-coenzyme A synthetase/AMP-(fatty) acid ligase